MRLKLYIFVSFFLAALILSAPSKAQYKTSGFIGSINGGLGIPLGDLSDGSGVGWNIGATAGYVFNNHLASRLDLTYSSFSPAPFGSLLSIITFRGDFLVGNFERKSNIIPYGFAGFGIYSTSSPAYNIFVYDANGNLISTIAVPSNSKTDIGIAAGGGVGFKVSQSIVLYGEAAYCLGFGNNPLTNYIPFKAGIMITP
jgi:opacity protein-like surface antigen